MNQSSDQISAFIASTPLGSPRSTPRISKRPQKGFHPYSVINRGPSSQFWSSLYSPMRNFDQMTVEKTHSTLSKLYYDILWSITWYSPLGLCSSHLDSRYVSTVSSMKPLSRIRFCIKMTDWDRLRLKPTLIWMKRWVTQGNDADFTYSLNRWLRDFLKHDCDSIRLAIC